MNQISCDDFHDFPGANFGGQTKGDAANHRSKKFYRRTLFLQKFYKKVILLNPVIYYIVTVHTLILLGDMKLSHLPIAFVQ